jgi:hypothetical protein
VTAGFHPDDAKAILAVLVGDALDQSGQHLHSDQGGSVFMTTIVPVWCSRGPAKTIGGTLGARTLSVRREAVPMPTRQKWFAK